MHQLCCLLVSQKLQMKYCTPKKVRCCVSSLKTQGPNLARTWLNLEGVDRICCLVSAAAHCWLCLISLWLKSGSRLCVGFCRIQRILQNPADSGKICRICVGSLLIILDVSVTRVCGNLMVWPRSPAWSLLLLSTRILSPGLRSG